MRQSILAVLHAGLVLAVCGCGGGDDASKVKDATPVATVTSADLIKAYADDFGAADQQYKTKVIVVDGFVEGISPDPDLPTINLDDDPGKTTDFNSPFVACDFDKSVALPKVNIGDRIKIKGVCEGKMGNVIALANCVPAE
jgi:hypothetical protein